MLHHFKVISVAMSCAVFFWREGSLAKNILVDLKKNITEMIIFLLTIGERAFSIISGGGNPFFSDGIWQCAAAHIFATLIYNNNIIIVIINCTEILGKHMTKFLLGYVYMKKYTKILPMIIYDMSI